MGCLRAFPQCVFSSETDSLPTMYAFWMIFQFESYGGLRVGDAEISYFDIFQMRFYCWLEMLPCFWKVIPCTKKRGWKSWKQNKTVWNCRNKMFQFNMTKNISGELPLWWFYPFRNPKSICKYPFPIAEGGGYEMQPRMLCSKILLVPFFTLHGAPCFDFTSSLRYILSQHKRLYALSFLTQDCVWDTFTTGYSAWQIGSWSKRRATNMWHVSLPGREFEVEASCESYILWVRPERPVL